MTNKNGIHWPNSGYHDVDKLLNINWGCFTLLHMDRGQCKTIREKYPNAPIMMRAYPDPSWNQWNPEQWATKVVEYATEVRQYTILWTPANEQNLKGEGHQEGAYPGHYPTRKCYEDIQAWNMRVIIEIKRLAPWIILVYPALSQGNSDDQNDAGYVGFEILRPSVELCPAIGVHTYFECQVPSNTWNSPWYGQRYKRVHNLFPNKPLFINEYSPIPQKAPEVPGTIKPWLDSLPDYVMGATCFIWDSDGANSEWTIYNKPALVQALKDYQPGGPPPIPPDPGGSVREPLDKNWPELQIERYKGGPPYWKLVDWEVQETGGGSHAIWVQPYKGTEPMFVPVRHFWPQNRVDGQEVIQSTLRDVAQRPDPPNMQPVAEFIMGGEGASNFDAEGHGPHNVHVVGNSDIVYGAGMPLNFHRFYRFVFHYIENEPVTTLEQAAWQACPKPMPINSAAWIYRYARTKMKYPMAQTEEFDFTFNGVTYTGQLMNDEEKPPYGGIVCVIKGQNNDPAKTWIIPKK